MTIGIGVITHNRIKILRRLVDQVFLTMKLNFCLFVSDDCSTDGTVEYLESHRIEHFSSPAHFGVVEKM